MKIANGIYMLEISANIMGTSSVINPTLIWDNDTVILIDTGFPGQLPQIREAIENVGVSFDKLNLVILTHQDIDHVGSLSTILKELPNSVKVLSHQEENAYIQGEKLPVKVAQLEANLNSLPNDLKALYEKLKAFYENNQAKVDKTLTDGEELPYCGGITVIYTPGHTPGHICLYHKQCKILIAGDALQLDGGELVQAPQSTNFDRDLSINSLKMLAKYDIETVICYHGGLFKDNANQRIAELANGHLH
ncbi:MBL fold metallo-hydrolase [Desulfosporosinus metallidurans]|uniref:Metal-dependent hydrolase n=1 Tax=Desulfosporosinus metallidurans TaxID=1888891 RepID=A0A1Q8QW45_9FIRM|nr:MBL fold metallo-hydrolase [Desulfosporosinus metallidurans]OLN31520.1 Metal-dependent hydrolase [Desulfosporosinus metallidurans]